MSQKSGTPSQVLSLPKGGGAIQGMGEKFAPDLQTGTGNFTVPLVLPAGRNGFQPTLNLTYSTGNGNGPFGQGWSLSIPGISRKTSGGIPRYINTEDIFLLSGAEDLVPVEQQAGLTRYCPRTEGTFARIEHHRDATNNFWKVWSKDGLISFYGTPRPTDASANWQDPAAIANPLKPENIFAWKLSLTVDTFGNRIEYDYERDAGDDGVHHWDQLYLKQVRYADYRNGNTTKFLVSVTFNYEDRPDAFSDYRAGFEIRTRRRCRQIEARTHAEVDRLVNTTELIYLDQRVKGANDPLAASLPVNGASLLSQVQVVGHDGDRTEAMPPLEFSYSQFAPKGRKFFPVQGRDLPARSLANQNLELVDLFGTGLPDILEMSGTVRYWRNLGNGTFDRPREMKDAPAGLQLADIGVQLIDADGDGRSDLMVTKDGLAGYFPSRFGGVWDRRSFQRYEVAPSFNLEDPEVKLMDLDGDGVTDAIRSSTRLECFFNHPQLGWHETRFVERQSLSEFPNVNFSDPRVKLADITGGGLQDILLVHDGKVEYWPNLGYGSWGKRILMTNSPRFPLGYDPKRILIGDVDGDGLADLIYVDNQKVTLWMNQSGNGWSEPIEIKGTPSVTDSDAVRLVDLLGMGVAGILWSTDADGRSRSNLFFLDFTGEVKPYLLNEMNNHMGAITRVGYTASTQFYLADSKRPETRWQTPLPFPVQVVSQVDVIDQISQGKLTTKYFYHHGYWDGAEREFRGFGRVDQRDTEVFEAFHANGLHGNQPFAQVAAKSFSPPLETRTWFHQGPIGDEFGDWEESDYSAEYWSGDPQVLTRPQSMMDMLKALPRRDRRDALRTLRGSTLRTELYALDGTTLQDRPYTVTESIQGVREESPPDKPERLRIFFSHGLAQRTTQWERGNDPMTQFAFTDDYDEYGQARSQVSIAVPRGRDYRVAAAPGEPYLATHAVATYANRADEQHYLIGHVVRSTGYEVLNDGSATVFDLNKTIQSGDASQRILSQALNYYDGPAFEGLPFGQLGEHGLLSRTESLAVTTEILAEAYRSELSSETNPELPPYLVQGSTPTWSDEYPQAFRDLLLPLAGYVYHPGGAGTDSAAGYFVTTERQHYDYQTSADGKGRGLLKAKRDALGHDTSLQYDNYDFLLTQVKNPAGLTTSAIYDYRIFQPIEVSDANGNRTIATFSPLGFVKSTAAMGKVGEAVGDTIDKPGAQLVYDFSAFRERQQPISVRTIQRVHHANETDVPLPERDETIERIEYSDGFGRLLQTRAQAEDIVFGDPTFGDAGLPIDQSLPGGDVVGQQHPANDHSWVAVSGWQIYDNKGQVVEKYEPFFSAGFDYQPPKDTELGQKAELYYDPRGQVIRTINPDGSEKRAIMGVPTDLTNPDAYTPTPWESYTYDANDNAGRTHAGSATSYQMHWNTPASIRVDALGRTVEAIARNGTNPATDWLVTRSVYDIQGNLLTVTDALGRIAFRHVYDLAKHSLRTESMDAGLKRMVLDAMGNLVEGRDSKGALTLHGYDLLSRSIRVWARDNSRQLLTLRERVVYGDASDSGFTSAQAAAVNLLGKPYQHYDEAGLMIVESCDFKGNPLEKVRQVIADAAILSVFEPAPTDWQISAFRLDWEPPVGTVLSDYASKLLDPTVYRTTLTYDGLNRVKSMSYPQDVEGKRKQLLPHYNRAGALERVTLDGATYVERIVYNAKGQRSLIIYGNGVMTRYAYDPKTFRLARLRTEHCTTPTPLTYHPTGAPLQDFVYQYDLVGNITAMKDRTPDSGILNTPLGKDALNRVFTYDPIYRLQSATGRECDLPPEPPPWIDKPRGADLTRTRGYTEQYQYDLAGNLTRLQHQSDSNSFVRELSLASHSNRLAKVAIGQTNFAYNYDADGNLIQENGARFFEWDFADRMRVFRTQAGNAEPSVYAQYFYDASGQRVQKLVRKQGGQVEITVYIGGIFEYQRIVQGSTIQENNTLHVMDNQSRIALVRVGTPFKDDTTPAVKYQLGDHLGSSNVVVDEQGNLVNREEHTPFGETSFGSFAKKRYRFTGKERDEESGLCYHGARYYAPWLARWTSTDPIGMKDGINLYAYVKNNPIMLVDQNGMEAGGASRNQDIVSDKTTPAGNRVFFHVVDWRGIAPEVQGDPNTGRKGFSAVGAQMAGLQATGFKPAQGAAGQFGTGVYAYSNEPEAVGLARGARRPYAAFKVDPSTPVRDIQIRNSITGRIETYTIVAPGNTNNLHPSEMEFKSVTPLQVQTYHADLSEARLPPVRINRTPPPPPPIKPSSGPPRTPPSSSPPAAPFGGSSSAGGSSIAAAGKSLARGLIPFVAEVEDALIPIGDPYKVSTWVTAATITKLYIQQTATSVGAATQVGVAKVGAAISSAAEATSTALIVWGSRFVTLPIVIPKKMLEGGMGCSVPEA